ncbi:MAG: hypothetical protein JWN73_3875 [Betaproteobacteria bacterium]|nr:hypothetical protein [Betaproteobacteria bacterium]
MTPQTAVPPAASAAQPAVTTAQLLTAYRASFDAGFDLQAFESDDFYAFQVLERAIREGAPGLREAAKEMERVRLEAIDSAADIDYSAPVERLPAPLLPSTLALPLPAAQPLPEAPRAKRESAQERRRAAAKGHVRLGNREIVLLSQMRVQYRKTYGMFFDSFAFTGNDLYARAVIKLCLDSGNWPLAAMARQFQNEDGTPRYHRRLGNADMDVVEVKDPQDTETAAAH